MRKPVIKFYAIILSVVLALSVNLPSYAYTVKEGDTLGKIAKENHVSVDTILTWNNISDRNLIFPGQSVRLPSEIKISNKSLTSKEIEILGSMFDADYYALQNPDVVNQLGMDEAALFDHFCTCGLYELRQPNEEFNVTAYAAAYNDLSAAFGTDVILYYKHNYEFGRNEGRDLSTFEALEEIGVNTKALKEKQYTVTDENGRPQFNAFYEEGKKDFVIPEPEPAPAPAPAPTPTIWVVTFDLLKIAGEPVPENQYVADNGYVTRPSPDPSHNISTFLGWYKDVSCNEEWLFDQDTVTSDLTLYAKWDPSECLAAGTLITLANGEKKPVENLEFDDEIMVFDHETGKITTAKLFSLWKYPEKHATGMKLYFSGGTDITVMGGHDFFEKEANRYVPVTRDNVSEYIGHKFYNLENDRWDTLERAEFIEEELDSYIIATEKHLNCIANGMLSCEDGVFDRFINVFDFGPDLMIDGEKKAADIQEYGLWNYEDAKPISEYFFDSLNLKYLLIAYGKGIIIPSDFNAFIADTINEDPDWILN